MCCHNHPQHGAAQKLKAVVADAAYGTLKQPITLQDVLTGIRKQTGVVLHESYIRIPPTRSAANLFDSLGTYQLPVNIIFPNNDEAVIEVQVTARPSKDTKKAVASVDASAAVGDEESADANAPPQQEHP